MIRCPDTDLPPAECACPHHHQPAPTVITIGALEKLAGRPLPEYRPRLRPRWRVPTPEPTHCDHQKHDLCKTCDRLLDSLLADLPNLVEELGFAMRKDTRFTPHGHRKGDIQKPDEAPLPWNPSAARALTALHTFIADVRADPGRSRRRILADLSDLATWAHRIIERPKDREYTMCPKCRTEIVVEDHTLVICPSDNCRYMSTWDNHQSDLLDANGDALLTMSDLVLILTRAGEPIDRNRINYLIRRHGLPREEIENPHWREGRLVTEPQWAYRLNDVRELQARLVGDR